MMKGPGDDLTPTFIIEPNNYCTNFHRGSWLVSQYDTNHSLSKKSGWSWAFSDRYGRMGKGDEKMLERGKMDRDLVEFVVIDQLVPKEHLLRKIDAAVDFTQLYEMVEPLYCEDNGRPSIDPVVLVKMVLL